MKVYRSQGPFCRIEMGFPGHKAPLRIRTNMHNDPGAVKEFVLT